MAQHPHWPNRKLFRVWQNDPAALTTPGENPLKHSRRITGGLLFVLFGVYLQSCRDSTVDDALTEMRGPVYVKSFEYGAYSIEIRYVPKLLYALARSGIKGDAPIKGVFGEIAEKDSNFVFRVKIAPKDDLLPASDMRNDVFVSQTGEGMSYREVAERYSFGLRKSFRIKGPNGDIYPTSVLLANSWGIDKEKILTVIFPAAGLTDSMRTLSLTAEDLVPGSGPIAATWNLPISKYDAFK